MQISSDLLVSLLLVLFLHQWYFIFCLKMFLTSISKFLSLSYLLLLISKCLSWGLPTWGFTLPVAFLPVLISVRFTSYVMALTAVIATLISALSNCLCHCLHFCHMYILLLFFWLLQKLAPVLFLVLLQTPCNVAWHSEDNTIRGLTTYLLSAYIYNVCE